MVFLKYTKCFLLHAGMLVGVGCFFLSSCQKEGELLEAPAVTEIQVKVFSFNQDSRFAVFIDEGKIADSIPSNYRVTKMIEKAGDAQHFEVRDIITGITMVDTMIVLERPVAELSVVQFDTTAGTKPLLLTGKSEIAPDSARIGLYLEDPSITVPVDIYLYKADLMTSLVDTIPVHIFGKVNNRSATAFTTIAVDPNTILVAELRDAGSGALLPGIFNNVKVSENDLWSGIVGSLCIMPGTDTPSNVHSLLRVGVAWEGSDYWVMMCMMSF